MEDWKEYTLGELIELINGFAFKSKDFVTSGIPVIKIKNVKPNRILLNDLSYVSAETAQNAKCTKIQPSDILITMTGNRKDGGIDSWVGKVALFNHEGQYLLNQRVSAIRIKSPNIVDYRYLAYLLSSFESQLYFINHSNSSGGQANISPDVVNSYTVNLPSLQEQKNISKLLKSLDDKIELNRRINDNLEQQAQALFKAWFVDFEPFKDGKFVDSEFGRIPEGWKVPELGKVTKQITERVGQRTDIKVLSPITTGELVLSEDYFTKQVFSESTAKYIVVKPMQFAYNPARVNIGSMGMNTFPFNGCVSPVYVVFECENEYQYFFDYLRKTRTFKEEVISRSIGGVRQSLGYKDFALIKVIYPPKQVVDKFNEHYLSLLRLREFNEEENKKLSSSRDALLPRLMSGEIKLN